MEELQIILERYRLWYCSQKPHNFLCNGSILILFHFFWTGKPPLSHVETYITRKSSNIYTNLESYPSSKILDIIFFCKRHYFVRVIKILQNTIHKRVKRYFCNFLTIMLAIKKAKHHTWHQKALRHVRNFTFFANTSVF